MRVCRLHIMKIMMIITPHIWNTPLLQPPAPGTQTLAGCFLRKTFFFRHGRLPPHSLHLCLDWLNCCIFNYFNNPYSVIRSIRLDEMRHEARVTTCQPALNTNVSIRRRASGQWPISSSPGSQLRPIFPLCYAELAVRGWEKRNSGNISSFSCDDINAIKY